MGDSCLTKHCIDEHGWGQYECEYENCSYIAYSKEWLLYFFTFLIKIFMSPNALRTIFDPLKGKSPKTFENAYDL